MRAKRPPFGVGPVAVTFDRRGGVIAAYAALNAGGRGAAVFTRRLTRRGRFGPQRAVGPADASWGIDLHAATGKDGTVAVAWGSRPASECFTGPDRKIVYAAVRAARARTFRRARLLAAAPLDTCDSRKIELIVTPDGRSTIAEVVP